jgi:hypothetical protein
MEDGFKVFFHRERAYAEDDADLRIRFALSDPVQHLGLSGGETEIPEGSARIG